MRPIPIELVAQSTTSYDALQSVGEAIYWLEGDTLIRWTPAEGRTHALPGGIRVGSRVHEYGGGAYLATEQCIWYCDADDQRIYRATRKDAPKPITPEPDEPGALRYADLRLSVHGDLVCVRECDGGTRHEIVRLPADGSAEPQPIVTGADFYMSPELSPDGRHLAWVEWNAPLMPWDGSRLWIAEIGPGGGSLANPVLVAGSDDESVCQPQWGPDGAVHFASDRSGWWNLYGWREGITTPVIVGEFELAAAPWEFGYRTYLVHEQGITALAQKGPTHRLLEQAHGQLPREVTTPYTSAKPYLARAGTRTILIASSPEQLPTVVAVDSSGRIEALTSDDLGPPRDWITTPEPFTFSTRDGEAAHGLYYAPAGKGDGPPPLLVRVHPGPTANWPLRLDLHAQFFISRGIAVADIDHRGSTGYGRQYRLRLRSLWGVIDPADCVDAALCLAERGKVDRARMAIWGASAGGYTTLRALISEEVFVGGIARSSIVDPETWRHRAPTFQAHHPTLLMPDEQIGNEPLPSGVLLVHGDADHVVPIDYVTTAPGKAQVVAIKGAGHSFQTPAELKLVLESESEHLRTIFRGGRSR